MKVPAWLSLSLVLLASLARIDAASLEQRELKTEDMEKILTDIEGDYLIMLYSKSCEGECATTLKQIGQSFNDFKRLRSGLKVYIVNCENSPDILANFGVVGIYGVIFIHKTHVVRLDGTDLTPPQNVNIPMEVLRLLTKSPQILNDLESLSKAKEEDRYVNVFVGSPSTTYWSDIELLAMVSEKPVYYTTNEEVKQAISQTKEDTFITLDVQTDTIVKLKHYPEYAFIQRFISTSTSEVPLEFNIDNLREDTQSKFPVMIVFGDSSEDERLINDTLWKSITDVRADFFVYRITNKSDETQQTIVEFCTRDDAPARPDNICVLLSGDDDGRMYRYIYNQTSLNPTKLSRWLNKITSGELKPYYKAETIIEKHTGRVRNLNSYTLETFMSPSESDNARRLVLFYSDEAEDVPTKFIESFVKLSSEYSEKHLKFGRLNFDKNEITVSGADSGVLMLDGGFTGIEASYYQGEWDDSKVREWINNNIYESQTEEVEDESEPDAEGESSKTEANEILAESDEKIDL